MSEPDGFIVVHHPPEDDAVPYGVGPFPPDDRLAEAISQKTKCGCRIEVLWIAFPPGIVMGVAIDADEIIEKMVEIDGLMQAEKDRLN